MESTPKPSEGEPKCAACGHARESHIAINGPCKVHRGKDFCGCDHYSPARAIEPVPNA
jgi:hypothetical protein